MKRIVLILAMLAFSSSFSYGQAVAGAIRQIDIYAGGTFTYAVPDYTPQNALGYGIFAIADFTPHWGAELDFNSIYIQQHSPAKELTFEYGVRYHRDYGRYSPFLKLSAGRGTFDSNPNFYQGNKSLGYNMLVFGGGTDIAISNRISIRGALEYQDWFTGGLKSSIINSNGSGCGGYSQSGAPVSVCLPNGLTPALFQVGISYHFTGSEKIQ